MPPVVHRVLKEMLTLFLGEQEIHGRLVFQLGDGESERLARPLEVCMGSWGQSTGIKRPNDFPGIRRETIPFEILNVVEKNVFDNIKEKLDAIIWGINHPKK